MAGLADSLTVAVLLTLIFGAVGFYLYSRLSQNEKRVGLLENLLLSLKMSTEASLSGPDMVEPTSAPAPLSPSDVEEVSEEAYADMLKEIPSTRPEDSVASPSAPRPLPEQVTEAAPEQIPEGDAPEPVRKMDANYESLSLKELTALASQRGITTASRTKKGLLEALKKGDTPLEMSNSLGSVLEGSVIESGFVVDLEQTQA